MTTQAKPLHRLTLTALFGTYLYAALLVAGPWIFTVLGMLWLAGTGCTADCDDLSTFRSIIIYNSMYALVVTSPIAFAVGRYVSEQVHARRTEGVLWILAFSTAGFGIFSLGFVGFFYAFGTTLDSFCTLAAIQNAILIGCSWLLIPFVGAFLAYNGVLAAFAAGAGTMALLHWSLREQAALGLLLEFNVSFAVVNFVLLATIVRRFGSRIAFDALLPVRMARNWELPAAGLLYALGLWADKLIMWNFASEGRMNIAGALQTMPSYDTAMFWSQLSSIPVVTAFFVHVERRFGKLLREYHARTQERATLRELTELADGMKALILTGVFNAFVALCGMAGMMVFVSFGFMGELGLRPEYMGILRIALFSMVFYTGAMLCFSLLLQLDLRRQALQIVALFAFLNIVLTAAFLPLGPPFYGYGNMIAASITLLFGFRTLLRELSWLHYHSFITNNASV